MKRCLWCALAAGAALAVGGFIVAASGIVPIDASSGHWAITEWFLRFSMKRSVATHSLGVKVPENLRDPRLVQKGAWHYEIGCRSCHGAPGAPQPLIAASMLPPPPDLAPRIRESNPKRLFHVVKHGIKFSGMPAWPSQERDDEVWAVVAFLLEYPRLDAAAYRDLAGNLAATTTTTAATPAAEPTTATSVSREQARALPETSVANAAQRAAVASCIRCHGEDGRGHGNDTLPRLSGQRAVYLRKALEAYAAGTRHSGLMEPVAKALSAEAMRDAARYYEAASLTSTGERTESLASPRDSSGNAEAIRRGRLIAAEGIRDRRVPACVECHGPAGHRSKLEYPLLAGQPAAYLEQQLALFRESRRGGSDHAHVMAPIASRLTPEQARDVAHYFASLSAAATSRESTR